MRRAGWPKTLWRRDWLNAVRSSWPILVDTFGTGTVADEVLEKAVRKVFDLRPTSIIRDLDLRKPIYRRLAAYGHLGREELGVRFEQTDRVEALREAVRSL